MTRTRADVEARIAALHKMADDDGTDVNEASITNFWMFVERHKAPMPDAIIMDDDGRLRATWSFFFGRLAVVFLGGGSIRYAVWVGDKRSPFDVTIDGFLATRQD